MSDSSQAPSKPAAPHSNGTPAPGADSSELPKAYRPADVEQRITARWDAARAFHPDPARVLRGEAKPYCILIPPPNVTAALHLGHALNNTLQDVLIRAHRMMGFETLWMPGTDHAGIATQAVVEKRVLKEEGKRRKDFQRDEFVGKIQAFKDEYEATITEQLKAMGCSCDYDRQRFTMDDQCAAAVREAFFRLFKDGLIYRGKRLVNWDPALQTAVADDECYDEEIDGAFYYLRYPLVDISSTGPSPVLWADLADRGMLPPEGQATSQPAFITVATTRPETYLGDTAVGVSPHDPRAPALRGLHVRLPIVNRIVPIIEDDYVVLPKSLARNDEEANDPKAEFATGFLKVTPAHDQNDNDLYTRHKAVIDANSAGTGLINVMAPDASISDKHGWTDIGEAAIFLGLTREKARKKVVEEFQSRGLLEGTRPYRHSVKHSDRSKAIIEPYLSDQWYVRVTDPRMAESANRALVPEQRNNSASSESAVRLRERPGSGDGALKFYPARYAKTYEQWHDNIRDWCISRQLWWGHRIPVWHVTPRAEFPRPDGVSDCSAYEDFGSAVCNACHAVCSDHPPTVFTKWDSISNTTFVVVQDAESESRISRLASWINAGADPKTVNAVALTNEAEAAATQLATLVSRLDRDPDVLDTWFSSGLWPLSTLGWPDPTKFNAESNKGLLEAFNPSSVLCTAREIITLWVSRMVMFNRYFSGAGGGNGPVPYKDVFIHAMIQDGEGRKMSKSLGNGVDPRDIIESHGADAMRFTLVQMTTQTQDVRMPVSRDSKSGKNTSPKFDAGRNFCNKLWNAARFTLSILSQPGSAPATPSTGKPDLPSRWMLSRLESTTREVNAALANYEFSVYAQSMYDLLWRDFCDWYLEAVKPTAAANPHQRAVLAHALETILRLLHPIAPFVTEAIWERTRQVSTEPIPGFNLTDSRKGNLLCAAGWPVLDPSLRDEAAEREFDDLRALITAIREVRAAQTVQDKRKITLHASPAILNRCSAAPRLLETLSGLELITLDRPSGPSITFRALGEELHLSNLADAVDAGAEKDRLIKKLADAEKSASVIHKRLENPGYADKAPPKLIAESRAQLAKLLEEAAAMRTRLGELG